MPSLIDSSGWIEYFTNGPNASAFEKALLDDKDLIVPSITVFEVYRWVLREVGEKEALAATATMLQGTVINLDATLAINAADMSHRKRLPMADGIIWATGQQFGATIYTQDVDLDGLDSVVYIPHPKRGQTGR